MATSKSHVNIIALVKDGQRYVFVYDEKSLPELLHTFGRYAADATLNFTWYDAALLSQKVRRLQQELKTTSVPAPHASKKQRKPH